MAKKKKRVSSSAEEAQQSEVTNNESPETIPHQKKNKKQKKKSNEDDNTSNKETTKEVAIATVSIAIPGSIIDNAQSLELATRLAGQLARAATIFRIDEVVVFDNKSSSYDVSAVDTSDEEESGAAFLMRILQYLETPQYLRKALFPKHNNLRFVGMLPPLDAPHHLRKHEWGPYREGVILKEKPSKSKGSLVDVGLAKSIVVDQELESGVRVTVAMGTNRSLDSDVPRQVVSSSKPREEAGMYWGYKVRYAPNISSVFEGCPHKGGYDHLIGTSEHGLVIKSSELIIPTFRHLLIAFGGLAGLEECVEEDNNLKGKTARDVFDAYLNVCPHQGSRTIRTEEAIFISLQYFQEAINRALA
ncbi:hypothetical protein ACFE04_005150 [Oxalis oulophora]